MFFFAVFFDLYANLILRSVHSQLFKFFRDFDVFVKNVVFFVAGNVLDGFGIHSQNDAIGNECFPGSMVSDQFIFGFDMFPGFPT